MTNRKTAKTLEAVPCGFGTSPWPTVNTNSAPDHKRRRELGHIDLTSNHRTSHDVLHFEGIFTDVFDADITNSGDWHLKENHLILQRRMQTR